MAGLVLIEPTELYNLINQSSVYSNLSDPTYMILLASNEKRKRSICTKSLLKEFKHLSCYYRLMQDLVADARNKEAYNESHVVTSKRIKMKEDGCFLVPYDAELQCKEHVIVYDGNTNSILDDTPAINCACLLSEKGSRNPVKIVNGGYELFSALYPFLRTQKVIFMPRELDDFKPYPLEVISASLYIGTEKQAFAPYIQKDLKLKAYVNCNMEENIIFPPGNQLFPASVDGGNDADLSVYFDGANAFIESHMDEKCNVLIYSTRGDSRCVTLAIAFLMYHRKWSLEEAWNHIKKCCQVMRPTRSFVEQLSAYEEKLFGERKTDISDPNY